METIDAREMMKGLTANQLRFIVKAKSPIVFGVQPGTALRGALYNTLVKMFCDPNAPEEISPQHPVKWLLDRWEMNSDRGENIPRPITVEPPRHSHFFKPGETFTFGFTLIGQAQDMLPYVARAAGEMGKYGIGKPNAEQQRGIFTLESIAERCPLLDTQRRLMEGGVVKKPRLPVTAARVEDSATQLPQDRITLRFHTPTRLIANASLIREFDSVAFIKRIIERCQMMITYYAEAETHPDKETWYQLHKHLSAKAEALTVVHNTLQWVEAKSGSRRTNRWTPISGFTGDVTLVGDLTPFLPWFLWGSVLHIGKNAVKGNGWFDLIP
jgi:hypothetical protein